jgi:fibronectin type 3 domain-containing protein
MGYRILTSNSPEHEFSSLIESFGNDSLDYTGITQFKDSVSLETTTPYIYYRATALDNRYNESRYSDIIAVKRPDIIPPVTPVIIDVSVSDKSVTLYYAHSSSADVKYHIAFRKLSGEVKWDSLSVLGFADSVFTDNKVKPNIMYEYALLAVDSSGLKSPLSFPVSARPYYTGVLPVVTNLKIENKSDDMKTEIMLTWNYENSEGAYFVVYRGFGDALPLRYATIKEPGFKSFTDTQLTSGKGKYTYSVKVFDNLGGESKMSEMVNINVK